MSCIDLQIIMCQIERPSADPTVVATDSLKADVKAPANRVISWTELAKHNNAKDAWIAIKGRVYDVTDFVTLHPGGDIILTAAGCDATDVFAAFHSSTSAATMLPPLCVGSLDQPASPLLSKSGVDVEYVRDIQRLRSQVYSMRLFDSSKAYYAMKIMSNVSILTSSVLLALYAPNNKLAIIIAGAIMGLFWQQCGWLAHDFLHHQVFNYRPLNNVFGVLIGNIFQGFSVSWWKNKHNHHHAVPNVTDAPSGGDPDIATMPILFWSEKLFEQENLEDLPKWMLRNQAVLYWPIMCFARLSWLLQSALFFKGRPHNEYVTPMWLKVAEFVGLAIHHFSLIALLIAISSTSFINAFIFNAVAQATGGLFLSCVFTVGHNAMEVLTEREMRETDFIRLQTRTTRNVNPHWFTDWFCGGLNYQVEHHIFPSIPRHNLPALAKMFRQFCQKHSIRYSSETLIEGNMSVWNILGKVANTTPRA